MKTILKSGKVLLGVDKNQEFVFAEFELRHPAYWNKEKGNWEDESKVDFSASFMTVEPINEDNYDLEEYAEDWVEDFDKASKYDMCERYDCSPSELPEKIAEDWDDLRDAMDCSLYPECYEVDGSNWYFRSCCAGQHDTRDTGMEIVTSQNIYDKIHELWDKYHLKNVDEEVVKEVKELAEKCKLLQKYEKSWIKDYIRTEL